MIIDTRVVNIFKGQLKIKDLTGAKRDDIITEVGMRLSAIAVNSLRLDCPNKEQLDPMLIIIDDHFSDFAPDEFAIAVEYWIIDKLKQYGDTKPHFGRFTADFLSPILKAYRKYRAYHILEYDKSEIAEIEKSKIKEPPRPQIPPEQLALNEAKSTFDALSEFVRINKQLPMGTGMGWNWSSAYHWIKNGLKEVTMSLEEMKNFEKRTKALLISEHGLTEREKSRRSIMDAMPVSEYIPPDTLIWARMKKIFVKNYFIEKFKLNVQSEILFDSPGKAADQVQGPEQKKADHDTDEKTDHKKGD